MGSKTISVSDESREYDRSFHTAFSAVKEARSRFVKIRPHRAITPLRVTPSLLAQAIILPIILCGLLFLTKPLLLDFWHRCILFWSGGLNLPVSLFSQVNGAGQSTLLLSGGQAVTPMPSTTTMAVTMAVTLIAFVLSFGMKKATFPLKYPVRIVCVVQLIALVYFWFSSAPFPYSIAGHGEELLNVGYFVMLATPVMLGMGYYILNQSLPVKLFHTALILLFLAIMVPHQVLAHAFILQHMSVLFMPVLYVCFGAVFDALVFIALYSWVASNAPANATI